jgi:hypothetical protein
MDTSLKTKSATETNLFLANYKKNIQVGYNIEGYYCAFRTIKIDFTQIFLNASNA